MRRRGTSCMVPSPLCGNLVTFTSFINKARIKNHNFHKIAEAGTNVGLPWCADGGTKVSIDCVSTSIIKSSTFRRFSYAPLGCFTHALMFARGFASIGFTGALVDFMGKARIKISIFTICLSPTVLLYCCTSSSN